MIGLLTGTLAELEVSGKAIINVGGVGYEVILPMSNTSALVEGDTITLRIYTHVREDQITLFGFKDADSKRSFLTLISVSGIGPKVALSVLSSLTPAELARAISREDRTAFKGISGVGKKTMERLFVELKDKLHFISTNAGAESATTKRGTLKGNLQTTANALVQMGFKRSEAESAVQKLEERADDDPNKLLRDALSSLS